MGTWNARRRRVGFWHVKVGDKKGRGRGRKMWRECVDADMKTFWFE